MLDQAPLHASAIIKALGGPTALSRVLVAKRSAISNWPRDGIPAKYWPAIARHAQAARETKHITLETLEQHVAGTSTAASAEAAA